jgi:hypothetical protein
MTETELREMEARRHARDSLESDIPTLIAEVRRLQEELRSRDDALEWARQFQEELLTRLTRRGT